MTLGELSFALRLYLQASQPYGGTWVDFEQWLKDQDIDIGTLQPRIVGTSGEL